MSVFSGYVASLKKAPKDVLGLFKGPNKVKHILFASGGAVGTYLLGGMATQGVLVPLLNKVGAGNVMANPIAKRVVGGLVPFTLGYVGSKLVKGDIGKALLVGGAVASIAEIVAPGSILMLMHRVAPAPVAQVAAAAPAAAAGPVHGMNGLGGYVDSPSYQGTGGYVDSPSYQGTGGYVDSPSYQGTGDDGDDLAQAELADGYIDEGAKYMDSYLTAGAASN